MNKVTGGELLIAGTSVGAGMLALPVSTAPAGLLISICVTVLCWLFMFYTGLLTLEANLQVPEGGNFISMAGATLGPMGRKLTWLVYLLLLYSLMAAYLSGGGSVINDVLHSQVSLTVPNAVGPFAWALIVATLLFFGVSLVDGCNRFLMIGICVTYFALIFLAVPHVHIAEKLAVGHPSTILLALTVVIVSFGYHVVIPSVRGYLQSDKKKLVRTILIGSLIPLFIYIAWELIIFGLLPTDGQGGLLQILKAGDPSVGLTHALAAKLDSTAVVMVVDFFVFFAIASSFLGIALSLFDFIADGLSISKTTKGKLLVMLITFVPPLLYAGIYPEGFILALSYGGVFVAILHGLLPALMVISGRRKKVALPYKAPGGALCLIGVIVISVAVIVLSL